MDFEKKLLSKRPDSLDVCLVNMPYADLVRPSIALSLIQSVLQTAGIRSKVMYANLWFSEEIGLVSYEIGQLLPDLFVGDWTFAEAAFPESRCDNDCYLDRIIRIVGPGLSREDVVGNTTQGKECLQSIRVEANKFVEKAAQRILARSPKIVGCTSSFLQHVSSLALLRKIHELDPSVITVMGGANCETIMGLTTHRCFPWVDYVVSGEADHIAVGMFKKILVHRRDITPDDLPPGVWGPVHRQQNYASTSGGQLRLQRLIATELDSLPIPDYQDYFESLDQLSFGGHVKPALLFETSRGCWWGSLHKCRFCGLNGMGVKYRTKSPKRILLEIRQLEKRYNVNRFEAVDNILSMDYFSSVLPELEKDNSNRMLFFETKANLKRKHLEQLKRAGVMWIQPGIESLLTDVLKIMRKGVKGWQNIQLLKWARELGIRLSWHILWRNPGEKDEWYATLASWLPLLEHLQPPNQVLQIRIHRYSYFFDHAKEVGLNLRVPPALSYIYDLPEVDRRGLSYSFIPEGWHGIFEDPLSTRYANWAGVQLADTAIKKWRTAFWTGLKPVLTMEDNGRQIEFIDTRRCARRTRFRVSGIARKIYLACEGAPLEKRLHRILREQHGIAGSMTELSKVVEELCEQGLLLKLDDRLIALALQGDVPCMPTVGECPLGIIVTQTESIAADSCALWEIEPELSSQ